jgi:hypothetical protein
MKFFALLVFVISSSTFACDLKEIRKDVVAHFKADLPVSSVVGEHKGVTKFKEMHLTDTMMRLRGEDFFITKLVFDILWSNGVKEEKEVLMAAVVDMANCRVENYEAGDVLGASISRM